MAVDPSMMSAGPMVPPPPMPAAPAPAGGASVPPAVAALPGIADLAQQQSLQMAEHQRQMAMMQEQMQKEIMMLIASLPTPNPAGEAAVSTPMTPMMSGAGAASPPPSMEMTGMSGAAPVGGAPSAY